MPEVPPAPAVVVTPTPTRPVRSGGGGVKETIESILVAFILAFVFRAFVVEAFVIPTGSMSTTLLGAHMRFHCPDCGYAFDLNWSDPHGGGGDDDDVNVPPNAGPINVPVYCPNCGFPMPLEQTGNPAVAYGDRILVLKYLYLLAAPKRWDVVVFKAPERPNQNYIKRLTGLPGEAVMVLDGDVYTRAPGEPADSTRFVVQPKPPGAQSAMWRLVYDNDYHPESGINRGGPAWHQPWRLAYGNGAAPEDPATHGRVFAFDDLHGQAKLTFDRLADPGAQGLTDYLVANQNTRNPSDEGRLIVPQRYASFENGGDLPVSDLDVRLTYRRSAGAGPFQIAMTKRDHTFTAELTPTTATLYHDVGGRRVTVGVPLRLRGGVGRDVRVELSNADYRATLRVDDVIVAQTTPAEYAPDLMALVREYRDSVTPPVPTVSLRVDDQQSRVSHLSLWRDVYYYNHNTLSGVGQVSHATPEDFPAGAQQLKPDEYFTQGDNSQLSWDARCWTGGIHLPGERLNVDPGRVPGRFLLGKAFYVYWPAGYRAADWLPSFVPDFQGMRLIR